MIRKRDVAVLALCGAIATCAYSERRHQQELASLRPPEPAYPIGVPSRPSRETTRRLKALMELGSVRDASRPMRTDMASDSVWYGLDVLDVPKDRVLGFVEDDMMFRARADTSGGVKPGNLPAPPSSPVMSKTDFELVPFGEWKVALIGRTYSKGWSIMLNGPRAPLKHRRAAVRRIVEQLKTRFSIDPRAGTIDNGWHDGEAFVINFSKPRSKDGRVQSKILDSVVVTTGAERMLLGIRMREGVSPDGVIRGSGDPLG